MPIPDRWWLQRMDPFRDLLDVQTEISRAVDSLFGQRSRPSAMMDRMWAPPIDIYETKDDLVVSVELPGIKENEVHVSMVGDVLSLRGQRVSNGEVREENYHRIERWSGTFERHIPLPIPVQSDTVRATYRDGVLEIRLPKPEEVKPREIKIQMG